MFNCNAFENKVMTYILLVECSKQASLVIMYGRYMVIFLLCFLPSSLPFILLDSSKNKNNEYCILATAFLQLHMHYCFFIFLIVLLLKALHVLM